MAWYEEQQCPICGKMFSPAPQHSLTDGHGNFVCSPHCSEEARKRSEKFFDCEKYDEQERARKREEYRKAREGKEINTSRAIKPVLIFDENGTFIRKALTQKAASIITGVSASTVSKICNGLQESCNGFSFRYEQEVNKSTKRYRY
jgi:hypothetical protein